MERSKHILHRNNSTRIITLEEWDSSPFKYLVSVYDDDKEQPTFFAHKEQHHAIANRNQQIENSKSLYGYTDGPA